MPFLLPALIALAGAFVAGVIEGGEPSLPLPSVVAAWPEVPGGPDSGEVGSGFGGLGYGPSLFPGGAEQAIGAEDFAAAGTLAAALRPSDLRAAPVPVPLSVSVKGPTAPDQAANPLQAELRGRIDGVVISAGLLADRTMIEAGPTKLVGGMAMAHAHGQGKESLEVRTAIAQTTNAARIALEVGPRIERRLPGGMTLFLDGKAEAQSAPPQSTAPWQPLAGPGFEGLGLIGLTGRTGLAR